MIWQRLLNEKEGCMSLILVMENPTDASLVDAREDAHVSRIVEVLSTRMNC